MFFLLFVTNYFLLIKRCGACPALLTTTGFFEWTFFSHYKLLVLIFFLLFVTNEALWRLSCPVDYNWVCYIHEFYCLPYQCSIVLVFLFRWYVLRRQLRTTSSDSILRRGGGLGSRPKKMHGERLEDGVEYHLMSPTPRR